MSLQFPVKIKSYQYCFFLKLFHLHCTNEWILLWHFHTCIRCFNPILPPLLLFHLVPLCLVSSFKSVLCICGTMISLFQSRVDLPAVVVFHFLPFPADDVNSFFFMDGSNLYVNIVAGSQGSHISSCPTAFLGVEEDLPYCLLHWLYQPCRKGTFSGIFVSSHV